MNALAKQHETPPLSALDIDDRVRALIADPTLRVIEQLDFFDCKFNTRYATGARGNVTREKRKRRGRPPEPLKNQLALIFKDRKVRSFDTGAGDRPVFSKGECAAMPAWFLRANLLKLSWLKPGTRDAIDIWEWIDERDPPKVKRFDHHGREVWVPYPFAFENACYVAGIDPEIVRDRFERYRTQEFPDAGRIKEHASDWLGHLNDLHDRAEADSLDEDDEDH